jgi:hypothetical protein
MLGLFSYVTVTDPAGGVFTESTVVGAPMVTMTGADGVRSVWYEIGAASAFAVPLEVRWQAKDQAVLTANFDNVSSSAAPTDSTPSSGGSPSTSSSLSTGVKAGISVGIVVIAVLAMLAALWFFKLRRRRHRQGPDTLDEKGGVEIDGFPKSAAVGRIRELQGVSVYRPMELDGVETERRLELEGSLGR